MSDATELEIRSGLLAAMRQARNAGASDKAILGAALPIVATLLDTVRPGARLLIDAPATVPRLEDPPK
jgi:hypothetical protein